MVYLAIVAFVGGVIGGAAGSILADVIVRKLWARAAKTTDLSTYGSRMAAYSALAMRRPDARNIVMDPARLRRKADGR